MFSLPGILGIFVILFIRPHEIFPVLQEVPLLYITFGIGLLGMALDLKLHLIQPIFTPQFPWVLLFFTWCVLSLVTSSPEAFSSEIVELMPTLIFYYLISHGIQNFRGFQYVAIMLVAISIFFCVIAIHQRFAPYGCVLIDNTSSSAYQEGLGKFDGRSCRPKSNDCYSDSSEPGRDYRCERIGLLGTTTIGHGRVRYRGKLQDPNELALTVSVSLALALGLLSGYHRKRLRFLLLGVTAILIALTVYFTQSRSGELGFLTVIGIYIYKRFGLRAIIPLGILSVVVMTLLSGNRGTDASTSTLERLECWYEGMTMFRSSKFIGVGFSNFTEYHYLTAHNSYILVIAELGLPGILLWTSTLYTSIKIPIKVLTQFAGRKEAAIARHWAFTLLVSMASLCVGITFLSLSYHFVVWTYIALCGALYSAVKTHENRFQVPVGWIDWMLIILLSISETMGFYLFTRIRGTS